MLHFIREQLRKEPARYIAYGTAAVVWAVTRLAHLVGVEVVPDDVTLAVATVATFVLTEVIRRFVYSPASAEELRNAPPPGFTPPHP